MRSDSAFVAVGLVIGLAFAGSHAAAQSSVEDFESSSYQEQLDPALGVEPQYARSRPRYTAYSGADIGVPVVLNVDHDLIRPGANLHVQGGLDLNYFAAFLHGGWRWVPIDYGRAAEANNTTYGTDGRTPLKNGYFGLGLRGQVPNRSRVLPYASVSFDFNFWNLNEEDVACVGYNYWYCYEYDVYRFTPGFSGRVGTAIELGNSVYVDFGVGLSMSFEGDFFDRNESWVEPYVGVMRRM
jgi:hypothetical protein